MNSNTNNFKIDLHTEVTQIETIQDSSLGIMRWGKTNSFPQTLRNLIEQSPSAKAAVDRTAKFFKGKGFVGEDEIINPQGLTLRQLVDILADDLAYYEAFAYQCNYNLNGAITSINPLRIATLRFNQLDELDFASKIGYHSNFGMNSTVRKTITNYCTSGKIKWINRFNPPAVQDQISKTRGGIGNYLGQVLYYSATGHSSYPVPKLQASINYVLADIENSILVRKETATGFINTYLLKTMLDSEDPNLIALENAIEEAQGARGTGKVISMTGLSEEEMKNTVLEEIGAGAGTSGAIIDSATKGYDLAKKVITGAYLIPPILSGADQKTGFSSSDLKEAYFVFNAITQEGRDTIESELNRALAISTFKTKKIKIEKLKLDEDEKDTNVTQDPALTSLLKEIKNLVMGGPGSGRNPEGDSTEVTGTPESVGKIVEDSNGVQTSKDPNEVEMKHYTDSSNIDSIRENGFNDSSNSMYGQGVYFTNKSLESLGSGREASIEISVEPHNQLYVDKDYDINKIVSNATGQNITNSFQIQKALTDKGYKSIRVNKDDGEVYTVILDKSIIKMKPAR